jgi:hypothetical protein
MGMNGKGNLFGRALEREMRRPAPRQAQALRIMLGLSFAEAAKGSGLSIAAVKAVEELDGEGWPIQCPNSREALSAYYAGLGGRWCDQEFHDEHLVYLKAGSADDRRAINAVLALMGHCQDRKQRPVTARMLAKRVERRAGIPEGEIVRALAGKMHLTPLMIAECFHQLRNKPPLADAGGAGCYFIAADGGGWSGVGCDYRGCWW